MSMKRRIRVILAALLVCVLSVVGVKMVYSLPNEFSDEVGCSLYPGWLVRSWSSEYNTRYIIPECDREYAF